VKITRRQLRRIIKEEMILCEAARPMISVSSITSALDPEKSGLQANIDSGFLADDVTTGEYLKFMNIMYRSQIDEGHFRQHFVDFAEKKQIKRPITGDMINMMTVALNLEDCPMTSDDWAHFRKLLGLN